MSPNNEPPVRFRLWHIFVALAVLAVALTIAKKWPFVSDAAVDRVKPGMTEREVIEVMGPHYTRQGEIRGTYDLTWKRCSFWGIAIVTFSPDGRVMEAYND
jgi:hypothetical protein